MLNKREIVQGNKKIIYEVHFDDDKYKGITVDILDLSNPMPDVRYMSINPSIYVHNIVTNFNPIATSHELGEDVICQPNECYIVDGDIWSGGLTNRFKGDYLGNIIFNTPGGKKIACFISQNGDIKQRYYKFLDLTFGNILACTEWDLDYEYLGEPSDEEGHNEYLRALYEMKTEMEFTTQISVDGKEELIEYNGEGITEEGAKKYDIFKRNIMDVIEEGYNLLQVQEKESLEEHNDLNAGR